MLLGCHKSEHVCVQKQAGLFADLQGCALFSFPLPKQRKPRSQSKFAGEGPSVSFHPLSHKMSFCAVRGRESTRAWASVTEPHQGHTNITSVHLLLLHGCISLITKHCTERWSTCRVKSWCLQDCLQVYLAGLAAKFGLSPRRYSRERIGITVSPNEQRMSKKLFFHQHTHWDCSRCTKGDCCCNHDTKVSISQHILSVCRRQ